MSSAAEEARSRAVQGADLDPPGDVHASADYRRHLAEVVAIRAVGGKGELMEPDRGQRISVEVNGESHEREVEARRLLVHFLRDDLDLTGTHVGCDTGNCGACTVILDGVAIKSCMMLAVQADGAGDRDGRRAGAGRRAPSAPEGLRRAPTRSSAATARPGC